MKKILGALFALTLCVTMFSFAASAADTNLVWSLSTDKTAAVQNDTIALTIALTNNAGMASQYIDVKFDPTALNYVPVSGTALTRKYYLGDVGFNYTEASQFLQTEYIGQGIVRWIGAASVNSTATGDFMYLTFQVKTAEAKKTSISIQLSGKDTTAAPATVGANPILLTYNEPSTDINLNGYVAPVAHTLSFDANTTDPVSNMPTAQTVNSSVVFDLTKVPLPVRSGYDCIGWSTDKTNVVSSVTMPNADLTVYAIWQAKAPSTYTLSFDKNTTDNVTSMPAVQTLNANTEFDLSTLTAPERFGYEFSGWSTDTTTANIVSKITLTNANKTLYAIWRLKEVSSETQAPTSTRLGKKEIRDMFGNLIRTEDIPMLPHFGTQRAKQVSQGTTATSPTTTVRLIMGINSLEYTKAGFIVAALGDLNKTDFNAATDKNTILINESTVYTSITAADGQTYTAANFGAKYLVAIEIKDFPLEAYSKDMRVQGFVIGMDGTYHYDTASIIKVSDLFAK